MTPRLIVAIDPGNCTGVAFFLDGKLVRAYDAKPDGKLDFPVPFGWGGGIGSRDSLGVIELPKFYGQERYDGDPRKATATANSLIREAVTLGRWVERLAIAGIPYETVEPSTWKGQVSKEGMNNRTMRALALDEVVHVPVIARSRLHNVLDAIGVGLWYLKRIGPGVGRGMNRHPFKEV